MEVFLLISAGLILSFVIAFGNYQLYYSAFFNERLNCSSITDKAWFRGLFVPFIYFPGLSVIGLLILFYIRAMKALDINQ